MSLGIQLEQKDTYWKHVSGLQVGPRDDDKREGPKGYFLERGSSPGLLKL